MPLPISALLAHNGYVRRAGAHASRLPSNASNRGGLKTFGWVQWCAITRLADRDGRRPGNASLPVPQPITIEPQLLASNGRAQLILPSTWTCSGRVFECTLGPWQRYREMKHEPAAQVLAPVVGGSSCSATMQATAPNSGRSCFTPMEKTTLKPRAPTRGPHLDTIQKRMQQPSDDLRHLCCCSILCTCRVTSMQMLHPNPNSTGEVSKIPSLVSALPSLARSRVSLSQG